MAILQTYTTYCAPVSLLTDIGSFLSTGGISIPTIPACTHPIQFDEAAHVYTVAGVERPSVTQILKDAGLIDTTWYTDEARQRGRAVHLAAQFLDEDDLIGTPFCRRTAATSRRGNASNRNRTSASAAIRKESS